MLNRLKRRRGEEGFTLIELLIVIVILAILAAIVVFAVGTTTTNAKQSACNADAKSVETAAEAYKAQQGTYPGTIANLTTSGPNGPWLRQAPYNGPIDTNHSYSISLGAGTGVVSVTTIKGTTVYDQQTSTDGCNAIP